MNCGWTKDLNNGSTTQIFSFISVIILYNLLTGLVSWMKELQPRNYINIHALFSWNYWSLVIKNVYWKFELETIKGWSFFSHQSNTIIGHIAIGSLIQILELETRNFFLFQLLFLSKCYAIFDLNCESNEGTSTQKSCLHSCIILLKLLVLWWLRMCIKSLSFKP